MLQKRNNIKLIVYTWLLVLLPGASIFSQSNDGYATDTVEVVAPGTVDAPGADAAAYQNNELYYEDQDEQKFESLKTVSDTVQWRTQPPGYYNKLRSEDAFGYVKTGIIRPEKPKIQAAPFRLNNIIVYVAIAVFIGFLLWYLISNNIIFTGRKPLDIKQESRNEEDPEDIFSIKYKQAIQKALQQKDYRLAIRLHYLQLLKMLADKKIINYRPEKTNFDYLVQLRPTGYYNDFFNATRNYEYSWYGLFNISEQQYQKIEQGFYELYKRMK